MNERRYAMVEHQLLLTVLLMCGPSERLRGIREAIEMYLAEQEDFTMRNGVPDGGGVSLKPVKTPRAASKPLKT